jgi:hypothetical protein
VNNLECLSLAAGYFKNAAAAYYESLHQQPPEPDAQQHHANASTLPKKTHPMSAAAYMLDPP